MIAGALPAPARMQPALDLATAQYVVEVAAIAAFAVSGVMEAARKRLDPVGVIVVACLTSFGGGTLRDLLLDRRPLFWVQHSEYLWGVFALSVAAMLVMRRRHLPPTARAIVWPDALGLGLFAATGTQLALESEWPALAAAVIGVVTAVFGGVLRDIVCNEIPVAFRDRRPYALCAFAGGWAVIGATALGAGDAASLAAGTVVAVALRAFTLQFDWRLPALRID